ncbi:MAG: sulfatase-like hydrolase/transferase [Chthoniobacterales bacterium]|nr:sulfatase-like hydrolase/transferase [Chthoniobacterales bacterium]
MAKDGAIFTDWYGQQSCTAGRAKFITGPSPIRTGLTQVGLPGAPDGMKVEDPTIPTLLKAQGYVTGQFGKKEDTGPLTRKRMETFDEEVSTKAIDFMERAVKEDKPFFVWSNSTKMHIFTHLKEGLAGKTGLGIYADGMVEHDRQVGELLAKLKELGIDENTIVMYSTDNGAEAFTWPDGGTTMFRGEKNTQWEGGYRVPCVIKWPGVIKPGTVLNDIGSHEDMLPTLVAAAGNPDATAQLLKGASVGGRDYKVHIDGYNLLPALQGEGQWPRRDFIYWTDDGSVAALRYDDWKITFLKQNAHGMHVWLQPFEELRAPMLNNLRMDPFELAQDIGMDYDRWYLEHMFVIAPATAYVGKWLQSFKEFPPRQKPGSFNLERVMEQVTSLSQ